MRLVCAAAQSVLDAYTTGTAKQAALRARAARRSPKAAGLPLLMPAVGVVDLTGKYMGGYFI